MRIGALIIGFIAALTIGTMAATSTLLPALEYVQEQADRKLNELRRFANTQVHGTPGRFINNDYMEGDCYPQNMDFKYADTPTAHTVQVRTEGESILVTDDLGRTHVLAGIGPIPKNEEYAQRATELLVRGDHPVTIYLLEGKQRDGHTTAVLGLGEDQDSLNAKLVMERVAWHPSQRGGRLVPDLLRQPAAHQPMGVRPVANGGHLGVRPQPGPVPKSLPKRRGIGPGAGEPAGRQAENQTKPEDTVE